MQPKGFAREDDLPDTFWWVRGGITNRVVSPSGVDPVLWEQRVRPVERAARKLAVYREMLPLSLLAGSVLAAMLVRLLPVFRDNLPVPVVKWAPAAAATYVVVAGVWIGIGFVREWKDIRFSGYVLREFDLAVRSGGFTQSETLLPRRLIRRVNISQSAAQRRYGVASMRVTASGAPVTIWDVRHEDALTLQAELIPDS